MDTAIDLEVNIDGKKLKHPEQYRVASPKGGFKFTAVADNPFATPPGHGTGVSDGFWILTVHCLRENTRFHLMGY